MTLHSKECSWNGRVFDSVWIRFVIGTFDQFVIVQDVFDMKFDLIKYLFAIMVSKIDVDFIWTGL